jgi:HEAT repeat protein
MTPSDRTAPGGTVDRPTRRKRWRGLLLKLLVPLLVAGALAARTYFVFPSVRIWVLDQAAALGKPGLPLVLRSLEDSDQYVRQSAREALKRMGPTAAAALAQAVRDPEPDQRVRALRGLDVIGPDARAELPTVTEALTDADSDVRQAAAITLASVTRDTDAAVPALLKALTTDREAEVRAQAATALGRIGPAAHAAVPELIRALRNDSAGKVREEAAQSLGRLGAGSAEALVALAEALDDPEAFDEAREALQRMPVEDLSPLFRALKDNDVHRRRMAARALSLVRFQGREAREAIPPLQDALKDQDDGVRQDAARSLGVLRQGREEEAAPADGEGRGPAPP